MLEKVIENWTSRLDYIRASRGSPMPELIFKIQQVGELYWALALSCGGGGGWDWLEEEKIYLLKGSRCRQSFAKKFGGAKSKRHGNRWAFAGEGNKGANTNNGMEEEGFLVSVSACTGAKILNAYSAGQKSTFDC
ncbi:hypothetical protein TNCV_1003741 [Trichonephila clavipes]|nr:hypothetical protein TNCV_1003741 [Trichonephila clavipes]